MKNREAIRVAIVEDNAKERARLEVCLDAAPDLQCVAACANTSEALSRIPVSRPDVIILDVNLGETPGGEEGVSLVPRLRESLGAGVQIMMLTVADSIPTLFRALEAGASSYLFKEEVGPDYAAVPDAVRAVCNGCAIMSASIARRTIKRFSALGEEQHHWSELLTQRESEVLGLVSRGMTSAEIAYELGEKHGKSLKEKTVNNHLHSIYRKLHVSSRAAAAELFRKNRFT